MSTRFKDSLLVRLLATLALLYLFLVGINCLGAGIKGLGSGVMDSYFAEGMNPVLGLLVGILATTLVQSSSVTSSLIVGLVGSGQLGVGSAVPMIMGANIGTTVTNTLASMAHATQNEEFKRAFAAATCHDFFNFLSVLVLLPVEVITKAITGRGILEAIAARVTEWTMGTQGATYKSPLKKAFKAGKAVVENTIEAFVSDPKVVFVLLAFAGAAIILVTLTLIVRTMRGVVVQRMEQYVDRILGSGGVVAMLIGIVLTIMVQSSSITTSIMVPLAGAGAVRLAQIYPITLGANIGTTVTALVASMAVAGETAVAARQIALVHLSFNLAGILIWYVPAYLRNLPLQMAEWFADFATRHKRWALLYVAGLFYGVPAVIVVLGGAG
ncbi:MAG: Na/Pi symporter [Myxococcota bacterium]|nr:Na/Pi symporter [Myxococcota bacterium]